MHATVMKPLTRLALYLCIALFALSAAGCHWPRHGHASRGYSHHGYRSAPPRHAAPHSGWRHGGPSHGHSRPTHSRR
ncbi:exported hypothetical protein [uncultured delta proteobacterium]|uniref:Lipoprotein n=1 Tax=uncultured delta proteobacterium TaxID=34034 RepID=A0A212JYA3_9DELT|nr:exported hypothetical protein [uncultured delta proteobacterium]